MVKIGIIIVPCPSCILRTHAIDLPILTTLLYFYDIPCSSYGVNYYTLQSCHSYAFLNQQVFRKVTRTHWAWQGLTGPCQIKAILIPGTRARIRVVIINANPK